MVNTSHNPMTAPVFEHGLGIITFFTHQPGIGGHLRESPEDFQVAELYQLPPSSDSGRYTIAEVTSRNWETHTLVQALAERLNIHPRRIAFAGTKDRRAVSTQLMSFEMVDLCNLTALTLHDVTIHPVLKSEAPLHLGQLIGNRFTITIHGCTANQETLQATLSPLEAIGGFPNFFGVQRFGGMRPITHLVGRSLTRGDFEAAVMTYIAHPLPTDSEEGFRLRSALERTRDFAEAYRTYPQSLNFERLILQRLIHDPMDFIGAIQALPKNLLLMFVNAYQSYLFNRMLSERIAQSLPLDQAIPGDVVVPLKDAHMQDHYIPVSAMNCEKVNQQIQRQKAAVTGLLFGSDSTLGTGAMGDIEQRILREEELDARAFIIPEVPFLSSSGTRRRILAPIHDLTWTVKTDDQHSKSTVVQLTFELLKGCYATAFLREVMKAAQAQDY